MAGRGPVPRSCKRRQTIGQMAASKGCGEQGMTTSEANGRRLGPAGFTRRGVLGAAASALAGPALGAVRRLAPSDRVNVAVIGAGGQGASNMSKLTGQNIVA